MPGWHYETAAEARDRRKKKKTMTKAQYRAYENAEHKLFVSNPANRYKDKTR